jgi:hypothetical protein
MKPKRTKADLIWGSPALNLNLSNRAIFGLRHFNQGLLAKRLLHPRNLFRSYFVSGSNDTNSLFLQRVKRLKEQTWRKWQHPEVLFNDG